MNKDQIKAQPWWTVPWRAKLKGGRGICAVPLFSSSKQGFWTSQACIQKTDDSVNFVVQFEKKSLTKELFTQDGGRRESIEKKWRDAAVSRANNSAFIALGLKQRQEGRELFLEPGDQGYVGRQEQRPPVAPLVMRALCPNADGLSHENVTSQFCKVCYVWMK